MTGPRSRSLLRQAEKQILPFNRMPNDWIGVAEVALRRAWSELLDNQVMYGIDVNTAREDFISEALVRVVNLLRGTSSHSVFVLLKKVFESISMGAGYRNFQGVAIQQPDIVFKPKAILYPGIQQDYFAIFTEAKIISDVAHHQTGTYFREGVTRFVDGRYAWAMRHGLMLAYVRSGLQVENGISGYLTRRTAARFGADADCLEPAGPPNPLPKVYITLHRRQWQYIGRSGSPGDIEIRHLWLGTAPAWQLPESRTER